MRPEFSLILRNVRSFASRHEVPLRPITLLIGENSTGKSTFLAVLAAIMDSSTFPLRPKLNEPPYDLGGYDSIVTSRRGRSGRAKEFSLGFSFKGANESSRSEALATYVGVKGQVTLSSFSLVSPRGELKVDASRVGLTAKLRLFVDPTPIETEFNVPHWHPDLSTALLTGLTRTLQPSQMSTVPMQFFDFLRSADAASAVASTVSVAPIRTKPKRTYDKTDETFSPEGDHIPILLSRILEAENDQERRMVLRDALQRFGEDSELFRDLRVRRLGSGPSDPFQLRVSMVGQTANLADVGYGVSQALPVIVQSVVAAPRGFLLLQQPEVHLHPKAQAALGSFFAHLASSQQKEFVIETHSDYLVDRIRRAVAHGEIPPAAVIILFFDRTQKGTRVFPISLDRNGNLVDPPRGYRRFFLEEESDLLTRTDE